MDINLDSTQTSLKISEDVVCAIANEAVKELECIYSLSNIPAKSLLTGTHPGLRPVRLSMISDSAIIDVGVIVNVNYKIREAAEHVQTAIKNAVQDMTAITVSKVNVFITGVKFQITTEK